MSEVFQTVPLRRSWVQTCLDRGRPIAEGKVGRQFRALLFSTRTGWVAGEIVWQVDAKKGEQLLFGKEDILQRLGEGRPLPWADHESVLSCAGLGIACAPCAVSDRMEIATLLRRKGARLVQSPPCLVNVAEWGSRRVFVALDAGAAVADTSLPG